MRQFTRNSLTIGMLLGTTVLTTPAHAQLATGLAPPPVFQIIDQNGVELQSGRLAKVLASISIGSGGRGSLGFDWSTDNSKQWPIWGYVHTTFTLNPAAGQAGEYTYIAHYSVTIGGSTETFTGPSAPGGPITQDQGRPSIFDGTTYTAEDGTVAVFGANFTEGYDSNGLVISDAPVTSLTYPTGEALNYYWNVYYNGNIGSAYLKSATSSLGYQLRLTWSGSQVTSAVVFNMNSETCDPTAASCTLIGSWPSLTWDAVNKRVVDNTGRWVGYTTDSSGNQVITYPSGRTITYGASGYNDGKGTSTYQLTGQYTSTVDIVRYPENTWGGPSRVVQWSSGLITADTIYDGTTGASLATNYTWNSKNQLTSVSHPDGTKVQYGYDGRGNLNQETEISGTPGTPANIVTSAVFPSTCSNLKTCNQPTSVTDARGYTTNYTYDPNSGQIATATSPAAPNGIKPQTRYSYAQFSANYRNGSGTIIAGSPVWKLSSMSECQTQSSCAGSADEVKSSITYDPNQALLPVSMSKESGTGSLTATTTMTYTGSGDVNTVDGPLPGIADTTRNYYDAMRRPLGYISAAPGNGQPMRAARITYDNDGRPGTIDVGTAVGQGDNDMTNMTSVQQQVTSYDAQGRAATVAAIAGGTTYSLIQKNYSAAGLTNCIAVRMNPPVYGSLPDACAVGTPGTYGADRITQYAHDGYFRPTSVTSGYGTADAATQLTNSYNSLGQLASVKDAKNNITSYSYDGMGRLVTTTYPNATTEQVTFDPNSNVTALRNRAGQTISYSYDALNRMTSKSGAIAGVNYTYDNLGRMLSASFASGGLGIANSFDALSRLTSTGNSMSGTAQTLSYQYDSAGRRTQLTYPDGNYVDYDYLVTGEVSAIRLNGATSGIGVVGSYAYDALGNRTSATNGNGTVTSYGYDPVSRLTSFTLDLAGSGSDLTKVFGYNPASEITSETRNNDAYAWNGAANVNRPYTTNNLNQYTAAGSASFGYDSNGNLTSDGTNTFIYDAENHLTSATVGGLTSTVSYDPLGRLWRILNSNTDSRYVYDGWNAVAEYSGSTLATHFIFGPAIDEPIAGFPSGSTLDRWFHADERGSIIAKTDSSGNANVIQSYDEYGIPGSANVTRFEYTGQMSPPSLGLYYYKSRFYSPTAGRFMQTDPIDYGDGLNWYAYTHNNPVNGIDPLGLSDPPLAAGWDTTPSCLLCNANASATIYNGQFSNITVTGYLSGWSANSMNPKADRNLGGGEFGFGFGADPMDLFGPGDGTEQQALEKLSEAGKDIISSPQFHCGWQALKENWKSLGLDTLGWAANFALPEGSAAVAIVGSAIGVAGLGVAIADNKGPADAAVSGSLALTGKYAAGAEGIIRGAGSAMAHRVGFAALAASTAYDVGKTALAYNACMSGK